MTRPDPVLGSPTPRAPECSKLARTAWWRRRLVLASLALSACQSTIAVTDEELLAIVDEYEKQ